MTQPTAGLVSRRRAGFTLIEMMMAVLLTMLVFAITIPFFRQQTMAVDNAAGRLDALQNARYAQSFIDRELRLAGGVTGQPIIVQAAPFAVTFNVDLVSRQAGDPNATYYNPSADSLSTESWEPSRKKALPTSAVLYPTKFYNDANNNQSPAETISYFLYLDGTSGRNDLYVLYRRVNDRDSTVIARNIWIPVDTAYFFKYSRTDATGNITAIPQASLPIYWNTANDPADSIRIVAMRVAGLYRDVRRAVDVTRTVYYNTRLLNAGMLKQALCGDPPLPPLLPVATQVYDLLHTYVTSVHLTWNASLEEAGGEKDVALYTLVRRPAAGIDWEVLGNVVAQGLASYSFDDFNPAPASSWVYGVVAQDCTPSNSTVASSATIVNP
jgi:type II secretory pathway pseudopilin PulG